MNHSNVSYMYDIHILNWRTTDEDRRSKYILDFFDLFYYGFFSSRTTILQFY